MTSPPSGLPTDFPTRSWLMIPVIEDAALAAAMRSGADIVVFDLASLKPPERPAAARKLAGFLASIDRSAKCAPVPFIAMPPADDETDMLLETVMPARPQGFLITAEDGRDLQEFDVLLAVHESLAGISDGETRIAIQFAEASRADLAGYSGRLIALGWSASAFLALSGAERMFDGTGQLSDAFRLARASVLIAAARAEVEAIDTASGLFSSERLARDIAEAAADGFTGKFTFTPRQVPAINHGFSPDQAAAEEARARLTGDEDLDRRTRLRALRILGRSDDR